MRTCCAPFALLIALSAVAPQTGQAQSAREILAATLERYETSVLRVDDYTVVQEVMGTTVTTQYEKQMLDGRPIFMAKSLDAGGQRIPVTTNEVSSDLVRMAEHATYLGQEEVDGHATHAIRIEEAGLTGWVEAAARAGGEGMKPRSLVMFVDAQEYLMRRMVIEADMVRGDQSSPVTSILDFTDYRTVDGLVHPFRTTLSVEGLTGSGSGMSPEDIERARKQLAEFEKQMAEMPEAQRQMMERMMAGQIDQLRKMLDTGGTSFTVEVKEIRVNTGSSG